MHNARGSNGFGVNPITYTEMKNYFELMDIDPLPQEVELIKKFDLKYLELQANQDSSSSK